VPDPDDITSLPYLYIAYWLANEVTRLSLLITIIGGPPPSSFSKQESSSSSKRAESLAFSTTAFPFSSTWPVYLSGSVDFFLLVNLLTSPLFSPCLLGDCVSFFCDYPPTILMVLLFLSLILSLIPCLTLASRSVTSAYSNTDSARFFPNSIKSASLNYTVAREFLDMYP
jgi:hypothetical protein